MKAFIVSDAHLGDTNAGRYRLFLDFLDFTGKENASHLVIAGDLFEFLYGKTGYAVKKYRLLFDRLETLSRKGTRIIYLYGNHDFNFTLPFDFIESMPVLDSLKIDGVNISVFHGDGLDPLDYKYRFLKGVVRSRLFKLFAGLVPSQLLYMMAGYFAILSRKAGSGFILKRKRYLYYRDYAVHVLKNYPIDIYVLGHTHVAEIHRVEVEGKSKYYVNTGFFGGTGSYAKIENGIVELARFGA